MKATSAALAALTPSFGTAQTSADGYTLLLSTQSFAINDALTPGSAFKPDVSFAPVVLLGAKT